MNIQQAILSVLAYFDLLDYPLTLQELRKWLWQEKGNAEEIVHILEHDAHCRAVVTTEDGVYFFRGREDAVRERRVHERMSMQKWRRIRFVVFLLRHVPFLRGIFLTNSLAYENADEDSDIDLFCIGERGHLWTVRFFAAGLMKILNLRPKPGHAKNGICLSFFVATDHLDLRSFLLPPLQHAGAPIPDAHFIYWLSQFYPLYSDQRVKEQFWVENRWVETYLPNHHFAEGLTYERRSTFQRSLEGAFLLLGPAVERGLRAMQWFILPNILRSMANKDTRVVMNDRVLKFHTHDRRAEYRERWVANYRHYYASMD